MSRSLKDLDRDELIELVVRLSTEYDKIADENDRLNRLILERSLPRSVKVGSIAEAALQVNGYFEAVQRSADEYLREIKHLKDKLASHVSVQDVERLEARAAAAQQAEAEAYAALQHTQQQMGLIVDNAQAQAEAIMADAHAKAEQILVQANEQVREITFQIQRQSGLASAPSATVPQSDALQSTAANSERKHVSRQGAVPSEAAAQAKATRTPSPSQTAEIFRRARHLRA